MASLRGFVSFVVILSCLGHSCAAEVCTSYHLSPNTTPPKQKLTRPISVPESEHLCTKVMSGRFKRIPIVTIRRFMKLRPTRPFSGVLRNVSHFMEKTNNPHEIRLVHRDNGSNGSRQLLGGALPNGFQYNGSQYLFVGSLGCVYVIQENFEEFNLTRQFETGKFDIRLKRLNIPYERYFNCPTKYNLAADFAKRYRADRCDSVAMGGDEDGTRMAPPVGQVRSMLIPLFVKIVKFQFVNAILVTCCCGLASCLNCRCEVRSSHCEPYHRRRFMLVALKQGQIGLKELESSIGSNGSSSWTWYYSTDASGPTFTGVATSSVDATVGH